MTNQEIPPSMVYVIAASPEFSKDGLCFSARQSGLFKSVDFGRTWQDAYASLSLPEAMPTQAVAISPDFGQDGTVLAAVQGAILRSTNRGETWQVHILPSPPPMATGLVFSPNYAVDGQAFFSSMEDGIFCSRDRGLHWNTWNFGLLDFQILCLAISPNFAVDETLFAGTETGIFISKNGGRAWKTTPFPTDSAPVTALAVSPQFASNPVIYAGTVNGELFCSPDGGKSWTSLYTFEDGVDQILVGRADANPPDLIVLSGSAVWHSSDGGIGWEEQPIDLAEDDLVTTLAVPPGIDPSSSLLVGTMLNGVITVTQ